MDSDVFGLKILVCTTGRCAVELPGGMEERSVSLRRARVNDEERPGIGIMYQLVTIQIVSAIERPFADRTIVKGFVLLVGNHHRSFQRSR